MQKLGSIGNTLAKVKQHKRFKIKDLDCLKTANPDEVQNKLKTLFGQRVNLELQKEIILSPDRNRGSQEGVNTKQKQTTITSKKMALRLKSFNVGRIPDTPWLFLRTRYKKRFILPQSFSSVYIIPSFDLQRMIFLIHLSKLNSTLKD